MKKILSIMIIIVLSTILGLAYNASTNLSLRLLEATDDIRPFREDFNYNFELVDDLFDDVSLIEYGYLDGVTSAIQTQLTAKQPLDTGLTSIAGLTTAANKSIYTTSLDTYATYTLTVFARTILDDADASTVRSTLGIDLSLYYLKTEIDSLSEVETIYSKDILDTTELDTFSELQSLVADKTLVNEEDVFTIDANWVNIANPWADNEVVDDLTLTAADTTDTTCFVALWETITGAQKLKSDAALVYNAGTGLLGATEFAGGGAGLTGVGSTAATGLTVDAKEENTSSIVKGQPVYNSGSAGAAKALIGLADCDDATKVHAIGLAAEAISQNGNGTVRVGGLLTGVDSLGTNAVNPNGQTWSAGDALYLDDTAGGLSNVKPTVGHVIEVGHSLFGSNNNDAILVDIHHAISGIHVATGEDVILRVGDAAGSNKVYFKDYADVEVAYVDSDGGADFNSLILDTVLAVAEGGTNSGTALNNDFVMISNTGAIVESAAVTVTQLNYLQSASGTTGTTSTNLVFSTSPTFITPTLGTPAGGTLTSCDGLPISSGVSGLGSNVATFLATPSSSNLASALTDETGTGKAVFNVAPIIQQNVSTFSSVDTLATTDAGIVLVSAGSGYTLTLPTASGNTGLTYHFVKTDYNYNLITLDGDGGETFNYENSTGSPNTTYPRLNTPLAEVTIVSDGTNWQVIDEALGQVPKMRVYYNAPGQQQSLANTVVCIIWLDTEDYDIGSNFDNSTWISGTADGTVADHLQDDTASQFTADMLGYRVKNTTDNTYCFISAFNDAGDVTLSANIFTTGEGYEIKHSKFVCPIAGRYQFFSNIGYAATVADKRYANKIQLNSSDITNVLSHSSINENVYVNCSTEYQCSAADVITLGAWTNAGDTVDIQHGTAFTFLSVSLIEKE